jgi:hypothetical protein
MTYEVKMNTFVLFRNKNRATDKHPSHTGSGNVDGREFYFDAWVNESKAGEKYFSGKMKPKGEPSAKPEADYDDSGAAADAFTDEIPF